MKKLLVATGLLCCLVMGCGQEDERDEFLGVWEITTLTNTSGTVTVSEQTNNIYDRSVINLYNVDGDYSAQWFYHETDTRNWHPCKEFQGAFEYDSETGIITFVTSNTEGEISKSGSTLIIDFAISGKGRVSATELDELPNIDSEYYLSNTITCL